MIDLESRFYAKVEGCYLLEKFCIDSKTLYFASLVSQQWLYLCSFVYLDLDLDLHRLTSELENNAVALGLPVCLLSQPRYYDEFN